MYSGVRFVEPSQPALVFHLGQDLPSSHLSRIPGFMVASLDARRTLAGPDSQISLQHKHQHHAARREAAHSKRMRSGIFCDTRTTPSTNTCSELYSSHCLHFTLTRRFINRFYTAEHLTQNTQLAQNYSKTAHACCWMELTVSSV